MRTGSRELLGIPAENTPVVMLPVAWTKGTDFRPAPRPPALSITYFDSYGRTFEALPAARQPVRRLPGTTVETDIDAPVSAVWPLVSDINVPAEFSTEFIGARWEGEERGVGATFLARNNHPAVGEYEIRVWIDACEEKPGVRLAADVRPGPARRALAVRSVAGAGVGPGCALGRRWAPGSSGYGDGHRADAG